MDVIARLDTILPTLNDYVGRVDTTRLDDPTPCAEFTVRGLLDHLIGGTSMVAPQLRGGPAGSPPPVTDDGRPGVVKLCLEDVLAACKEPGAMERTVVTPFGPLPGSVLAPFLTVDMMVHTWDLSQATGQEYDPPAALVEQVLESAHALIAPQLRDGDTFADAVPVPDDAPAITRLVAFTGRAI